MSRFCVIFLLSILSLTPAFAQKTLWKHRWGSYYDDFARAIVRTSDKGYVVASESLDTAFPGHHGLTDLMLSKFDVTGKKLWERCYGGSSWEGMPGNGCLVELSDGDLVFTANTMSRDGDVGSTRDTGNQLKGDVWVVRVTSSGQIRWKTLIGGSATDQSHRLIRDSDNALYIAGMTQSNDGSFSGIHGIVNPGETRYRPDGFVALVSGTGALQWTRLYGGSGGDGILGMTTLGGGYFACAGNTFSADGDFPSQTGAYGGHFTMKIDRSGNISWSKFLPGSFVTSYETPKLAAVGTSGDFMYACSGEADSGIFANTTRVNDFNLVRFDKDGNVIWHRNYGGSNRETLHDIAGIPGGGFWLGGISRSADGDVGRSFNGVYPEDGWLLHVDNDGKVLQSIVTGGSFRDAIFAVLPADNGTVVIAGASDSWGQDLSGLPYYGVWDCWAAAIDPSKVSVESIANGQCSVTGYPVPCDDVFHLNGAVAVAVGYRVIDIFGRVVLSGTIQGGSAAIDVSGLMPGRYVAEIIDGQSKETIPLVKR